MAYSKDTESMLAKAKLKAGDRLRVSTGKGIFEGVLLPKPDESGSPGILTIKLDNGYNVGLDAKGATLEKLEGSVVLGKFATWVPPLKTGLPKLSLVATGGTISTKVDYKTGGVYMLSEPAEILEKVPELAEIAEIQRIKSPFRKASEDMDFKDWQVLAKEVVEELNSDSQGVIVTHGTDILHYTAAALSFMVRGLNKPVALVGAQRSPDRGSFDGAMNLICGARFCTSDAAEVAVVMHGTSSDDYCLAIPGTKVRKTHTSRRDAFQPINAKPWAKILPEKGVEFLEGGYNKRNGGKAEADTKFEPKTTILKVVPGTAAELLDFLVEKKYRGVVLEAFALGHAPATAKHSWVPSIKAAIDAGVTICVTSQSMFGRVHPNVYANLRKVSSTGALYLDDMLTETAFVKLGWVLGHAKNDEKIREMMFTNYAHEFNNRLQQDDFTGWKQ